ncbi:oligopeptidase B, putative [Bodo saltans]|uniref:Prolyl endopeptidase-like n=1 Tax=Bodo saltans TaxID=75058 RepID=A0A0S4JD26_BODSA|nr:oligopeptidase B, putative [Bodo saltans]|eukprot:CUG88312.1 oligopeptidase B, putative [Bodo saltans]
MSTSKVAAAVSASKRKVGAKKSSSLNASLAPPTYPRVPHTMSHHGDTREDPYYYFRDKKDTRIKKWLSAETDFSKTALNALCHSAHDALQASPHLFPPNLSPDSLDSLSDTMFKEMKSRWRETDMSLPSKDRSFWYFARTLEGQEHASYCRVPYIPGQTDRLLQDYAALLLADPYAELPKVVGEQVMLDVNVLQEEFSKPYVEVGDFDVSHDERFLVVSLDLSDGQEIFTLFVLSLDETNRDPGAQAPSSSSATSKTKQSLREVAQQAKDQRNRRNRGGDPTEAEAASVAPPHPPHTHTILRQIDMFPASSEVMWLPDDKGFLYFAMDDTQRPHRVVFHDLTKPADSEDADVILFQEDDPQFSCSTLCYTDDEQYVTFCVASKLQEECWVMPVADASRLHDYLSTSQWRFPLSLDSSEEVEDESNECEDAQRNASSSSVRVDPYKSTFPLFRVLKKREVHLEYDTTHVTFPAKKSPSDTNNESDNNNKSGAWLILSNRPGCRNFTLDFCLDGHHHGAATSPPQSTTTTTDESDELVPMSTWHSLISYDDEVKLDHVSATAHFVVIGCRYQGCPTSYVIPMYVLAATAAAIATGSQSARSLQDRTFAIPSSELLLLAHERGDDDTSSVRVDPYKSTFPLFRVLKKREVHLEYDTTHVTFPAKKSPSDTNNESDNNNKSGAWLILSNRPGCRNFTLDFCLDGHHHGAATSPSQSTTTTTDESDELVPMSTWHSLISYDDEVKLDHVSATAHFVVIGCRYQGCPTSYVIPMYVLAATAAAIATGSQSARSLQDRTFAIPSSELLLLAHERGDDDNNGGIASTTTNEEEELHFQHALAQRTDDWRSVLSIELSSNADDYDCSQLRLYVHDLPRSCVLTYLDERRTKKDTQNHHEDDSSAVAEEVLGHFAPPTLLRVDPTGGDSGAKKKRGASSALTIYDPSRYTVRRLWVQATTPCPITAYDTAPNNTPSVVQIPMTVVYRTDMFQEGVNACLITGYGSYGDCTDPEFTTERLSILDRGVVYAVAQIRGGGEMGRLWRDSGRMQHRMTSIQDFIDCSQYLVDHKFCAPDRLCSLGGSAGGTIVASAMLLAPSGLYKAVLPLVPFVDCLTTMLDPSIPLTTAEWEEWGNPLEDAAAYHTIKAYSPMDLLAAAEQQQQQQRGGGLRSVSGQVVVANVPRFVFVESGYGDPRVPHWEPMALVARLRDLVAAKREPTSKTYTPVVLHKCNLQAGHGGASGRYEQLRELADEYAFVVAAAYHP